MVKVVSGYKTIKNGGFYEENEKRSKFISYSFPVNSELQIQKYLKEIKSKYWDARHHVYAYSLRENFSEKYSDDGEPAGTAGLPIMNVIKSFDLNNVLIIIVRYFGGILLGTSGLRKMYGSGAKGAVLNAGITDMVLCTKISLNLDYKDYSKISGVVMEYGGKIANINYSDIINFSFYIKKDDSPIVLKKLADILKSNEKVEILSESYQSI